MGRAHEHPAPLPVSTPSVGGADATTSVLPDADELQRRVAELEQHNEELRRIVERTEAAMLCSTIDAVLEIMRAAVLELYPEVHVCVYQTTAGAELVLASHATCGDVCARTLTEATCKALERGVVHLSSPADRASSCAHAPADRLTICSPLAGGGVTHGALVLIFPADTQRDTEYLVTRVKSIAQRFAVAMTIVVQREELYRRAHTDELTGLLNRAAFVDEVSRILAAHQRNPRACSLLLLDLDGFKNVNDSHGHAAGDGMLQLVARCLLEHVREGDLCARFGGDEFAIVLIDADAPAARGTANRIITSIEKLRVEGSGVRCSVGIVSCEEGDLPWESWDGLYRVADAALYQSKQDGGGAAVLAGV